MRWMAIVPAIGLGLGLAVLAGCGGPKQSETMKVLKRPSPPPAVPARQAMPADESLRTAARRELDESLRSPQMLLRVYAIEGLRESIGAQASDQITSALDDPEWLVRFAAAMASGQLRLGDARSKLIELAGDENKNVRVAARFALHRLGDSSLSHDLEYTAHDLDPAVRGNTVMVLGMLEEQSALKILRSLMKDSNTAVRLQVAEAMWMLGDEQGLKSLVAWTISGYPDDQLIAVLALAKPRDTRVREHVRGLLTSDYAEVTLQAARAMGMLGSDEGYGVALVGAKHADWRQRHLAALALGAIGRSDAQPVLGKLLQDPEPIVRIAAATAILQLKEGQ